MKNRRRPHRRNLSSMIVTGIILFILVFLFGSNIIEVLRLTQLKRDLSAQITEREETSSRLDEDIAQIGSKAYIERIARNYLGLYYPDEQIVIPVENTSQAKSESGDKTEEETQLSDEPVITPGPSVESDEAGNPESGSSDTEKENTEDTEGTGESSEEETASETENEDVSQNSAQLGEEENE